MKKLFEIMVAKNISIAELSKASSVSQVTLRTIIDDSSHRVKKATAKKICNALSIKIKDVKEFQTLYNEGSFTSVECKTKKNNKEINNERHIKSTFKVKKAKQQPCRNHVCLLNKQGMCINDIVLNNIANCANKDVCKD